MKFSKTILVFFLLLGQSSLTFAGQMFVTDLVDGSGTLPIPGNQAWPGQLGDDFTVNNDISISSIGVFDDDGDGTLGALTWQLFNVGTGALIHTQTIGPSSATGGSTIESNYVWADLLSSISLSAGQTYSAVSYGFDNDDKNFNTNYNLDTLDVVFNTADITAAGGRYSNAAFGTLPTIGAGNVASAQLYNFGAATFEYSSVPEPSIIALFAAGLFGIGFARRRRTHN